MQILIRTATSLPILLRAPPAVWCSAVAMPGRFYATELAKAKPKQEVSTDVKPMERLKENTKTASYTGVIVLGVAVTGALFYAIFRELFSSSSSNSVYSAALDKCVNDPRVQDALGAPIKGFGEENSRRRRRHVAHTNYEKDGVKFMRMNFYIQGIRNKGTVFLEMQENDRGKFDYRYLFVQLEYFPKTTIILEDNRELLKTSSPALQELQPLH